MEESDGDGGWRVYCDLMTSTVIYIHVYDRVYYREGIVNTETDDTITVVYQH